MEYSVAFMLGLVGSLHCAAMCGPLQLAVPWPARTRGEAVKGRFLYHRSRILTYCLLGLLAGGIGHAAAVHGMQKLLSIAMGLAVLLGLLFSRKLSPSVFQTLFWLRRAMQSQLKERSLRSMFLLGLMNGLLPCGLVYVAVAGAIGLGSLFGAMVWMAAFGVGTLPMTLGISFSGRLIPGVVRLKYRGITIAGMILLSALLIVRGFGLGIPYLSPDLSQNAGSSCCAHLLPQ